MIEYLERLLDEGQDEKALAYAEQILKSSQSPSVEILAAHVALLRTRIGQHQWVEAIGPGQVAVEMAPQLAEWDYHGTACVYLSGVFGVLKQYQAAVDLLLQYAEHFPDYSGARKYELSAWFNLGRWYSAIGDGRKALTGLTKALLVAEAAGNERFAHGVRQALLEQRIRNGEMDGVPHLLVKCSHYLRHHSKESGARQSRLFLIKLRAEYAMLSGRPERALAVALRGVNESATNTDTLHLCSFHLLIARVNRMRGALRETLDHLASARRWARLGNWFDLESEASELVLEVVKSDPSVRADI